MDGGPDEDRLDDLRRQGDRLQRTQAWLWAALAGVFSGAVALGLLSLLGLRADGKSAGVTLLAALLSLGAAGVGGVAGWRLGRRTPVWQSGVCCRRR
jgi:hypothetical protein